MGCTTPEAVDVLLSSGLRLLVSFFTFSRVLVSKRLKSLTHSLSPVLFILDQINLFAYKKNSVYNESVHLIVKRCVILCCAIYSVARNFLEFACLPARLTIVSLSSTG